MEMEIVSIFAILFGPIFALLLNRFIEHIKEKKGRKEWVFHTLMSTRATPLSTERVSALNMIDTIFYGEKSVVDAWKAHLDVIQQSEEYFGSSESWNNKFRETFCTLLEKIAKKLGYDMDVTTIKNTSYFPQGHLEVEKEEGEIRRQALALLNGEKSLGIHPTELDEAACQRQIEIQTLLVEILKGTRAFPVTSRKNDEK